MKEIDSIKHKSSKRPHIPSIEEAGLESSNPKVKVKEKAEFPVNPVVVRGQDPELFWMDKYTNDNRESLLKVDIRSLYRHEHISPELLSPVSGGGEYSLPWLVNMITLGTL